MSDTTKSQENSVGQSQSHNQNFNRVQFDTVKNEIGLNRFIMTPTKWIQQMNAIGICSQKLMEDIPNKIQNKLGIVADVNLLEKDGMEYIEIAVSPWAFPVNYDGEYHYRSGSTKQQLRGNALINFLMSKTGMKWDAATISNVTVDDLDKESFDIFRREALRSGRMTGEDLDIPNEDLLDKLDLLVDGRLKRGGALCFLWVGQLKHCWRLTRQSLLIQI